MGEGEGRHYGPALSSSIGKGRRMIVLSPPWKVDECIGKPVAGMQGSNVRTGTPGFTVMTIVQRWRRSLEPALRRLFHLYWRFARGMTLGVRAVVLDAENRVFLVKHSYVSGWHLPGGGVETGETLHEALLRELAEEGRIELVGEPTLHGIYLNSHVSRRDHVAVYLVRHFRQDRLPEPNHEIIDCGFFGTQALPAETTEGTRLRISEVTENRPPIRTWR
jgi:ADP-ribose pyrophosphatase YjhB (NUDIX family)